jgi:hypothetical protein
MIGLGNGAGLVLDLRALRLAPVGIVATIASTEGALAAAFDVVAGRPLSLPLAVALGIVALGVVLTTIVPGEAEALEQPTILPAVILATGAAALFGLGLFATGRVGHQVPVVWALLPARLVVVLAVSVPLALRGRLTVSRRVVPLVVAAGFAEVIGFGAYAIGARDSVPIAAVLSSQFAAIALIAGWFLFRERISRIQMAGVALVIAGVAAVVLVTA